MKGESGLREVFAGIDIGGTAVRIVVLDGGRSGDALSVPTELFAAGQPAERVERLAELVSGLLPASAKLAGVGIGASGPVNVRRGMIDNPYTLSAFSGFSLVTALEARLGCPVLIEVDVVAAAIAEHRVGAGQGAARLVTVTLGTGIGVCLLIDGEPFRGLAGAHPEAGHIPITGETDRCYCGITGCWEQAASRLALQSRLGPLLPPGTPADLLVRRAAASASTDHAIREAFTAYGRLVGRGLSALQTTYMPDVVVLGGSAAAHLDLFRAGMDQELDRPAGYIPPMEVRGAALYEAGAVGAALLADERSRSGSVAARQARQEV